MTRRALLLLLLLGVARAAAAQPTSVTVSPLSFGAADWRENGLAPGSLPLSGNKAFQARLATDRRIYYWSGSAWIATEAAATLTALSPLSYSGNQLSLGTIGLGNLVGLCTGGQRVLLWASDGTVSCAAPAAGPTGPQGVAGTAATVAVGTVTTGAPGSAAAVANAGSSSAAILDLTIPRGDAGAAGATGATGVGTPGSAGPAGADGVPRTVQDEGVDLVQRLKINFAGPGVACTDNAGAGRTDCTIPGGGGGGGPLVAFKPANQSMNVNTTPRPDSDLAVTVASGGVYVVHAVLFWSHFVGGISVSLACSCTVTAMRVRFMPSDGSSILQMTSLGQIGSRVIAGGQASEVALDGVVEVGAGGTLSIAWSQAVLDGNMTILYQDSFLVATKM